jgi:uncharacterized secreted repeat protein (TIGR03808 family)
MIDRRRLIALGLAAPAAWPLRAAAAPSPVDATARLQRAIDAAQRDGGLVTLPPRATHVSNLRIAGPVRLVGAGASSRLAGPGSGPLLTIEKAERVSIENIAFAGEDRTLAGEAGLIEARDVGELRLADCRIERAAGYGLKAERCGGRIADCRFTDVAQGAIFSLDGAALSIVGNRIARCGANGVMVWRSTPGDDGAIIEGNHIAEVRADPGGDGPYGNAINVFRAGGVNCVSNIIRSAAFSAIRYNASSDAVISANNCFDIGETAIYVEFGFEGAVVSSNLVDGASTGVSITNFDRGGRLAAVTGNVVRNVVRPLPQGGAAFGIGIDVEADTIVSGNAVDNAAFAALKLGYGIGLRDVTAADNVLRDCGYGVAVSVAPGAGGATIRGNRIAGVRHGAIVGLAWDKLAVADLIAEAARFPLLSISGNDVR